MKLYISLIFFTTIFHSFCQETTDRDVTFNDISIIYQNFESFSGRSKLENVIADSLKEVPDVEYCDTVDISYQHVPVLHPGSISDMYWLNFFRFENNDLQEIKPGAFSNIPAIETIIIKNNQIREIRNGVFNTLKATDLFLANNSITAISANAFNDMPNLAHITLNQNHISVWHSDWFQRSPSLQNVEINHNVITYLPARAFKDIPSETIIDLSYNKISDLRRDIFSGSNKMDSINLDHNDIASIGEELLEDSRQEIIWLNDNNLTCLRDFSIFHNSYQQFLGGNPWSCECLNGEFKDYLDLDDFRDYCEKNEDCQLLNNKRDCIRV